MKAACSIEHMKVLAVDSSSADSHFQQLYKFRIVYEKYVKLGKETIPNAEKDLHELTRAGSKQRVKAAGSVEHMKMLAVDPSSADSHFQQLDKLHMVYEEYVKIGKEAIPNTEKDLHELTGSGSKVTGP
ncbi:dna repair protein rad50 [Quercus suber]|uniref:Dna repair protein rad50 n=1 Tax=Quercus suber TaxID=58331 RepID=A0AAW0KN47_QUESU